MAIVRGEVTDSKTGARLAGVTVSIAGLSTVTEQEGIFYFSEVPTGQQTISLTKTGYTPFSGSFTVVEGDNYLPLMLTPIGTTECTNGETKCEGGTLYSCVDGKWIAAGTCGNGSNWWDMIPGGWYTIAMAGGLVGLLAIVGAVAYSQQQQQMMQLLLSR